MIRSPGTNGRFVLTPPAAPRACRPVTAALELRDLHFGYGRAAAVRGVSLTLRPGDCYGFLGHNGAGKTTVLRLALGLVRPQRGSVRIFGVDALRDPVQAHAQVGALVERPGFHLAQSARSNLRALARLQGLPRTLAAAESGRVLELLGLAAAADAAVGTFSLGMRQRLGIAQALVGEPAALILDEPANGLDPEGIAWMRTLLRDFADRGGTVLLSSHLLHEVQATADHLVVISDGAVVTAGRLDDLLASSTILVRSVDPGALAAALRAAQIDYVTGPGDALTVDVAGGRITTEVLARVASDHQVLLTELRESETNGLAELFFSLTGTTVAADQEAAA